MAIPNRLFCTNHTTEALRYRRHGEIFWKSYSSHSVDSWFLHLLLRPKAAPGVSLFSWFPWESGNSRGRQSVYYPRYRISTSLDVQSHLTSVRKECCHAPSVAIRLDRLRHVFCLWPLCCRSRSPACGAETSCRCDNDCAPC